MNVVFRAFFVLVFTACCVPSVVSAAQASLALAPRDGTYIVGNEFTISVVLDSSDASVSVVEGKIRYLSDDIAVVRIEKADSPITSWVIEPDYATEPGLISFSGANADGMKGKGKTLFRVTFRVVRSGEARVRVTSGAAILAESGSGTNILTDLGGGTYTLVSEKDRAEALHGGPSLLRSSSHPDENAWYKEPNVSFEWSRSPDTDQARFSVDQNPEGSPTGTLEGGAEGKLMTLADGVWYGHLSLHDDSGWSPIGHLRLQIDSGRPEVLTVSEIPRVTADDPLPTLLLESSDSKSGISHYEISVDGSPPARYEDDGNHRYQLSVLSPGDHVVLVRVFDRAGNSISDTLVVHVAGLSLPIIQPIPSVVALGGDIDVEGKVDDGMTARVSIGFDGGESRTEDIASGPGGVFIHTFLFPQAGVYRFRVQAIDQRGATSEWTPEVAVRVEALSFLGAIGNVGAGGSGILVSLLFLVGGVIVGIWYGRRGKENVVPVFAPFRAEGIQEESSSRPSFFTKVRDASGAMISRVARLIPRKKPSMTTSFTHDAGGEHRPPMSVSRTAGHTVSLKRKTPDAPPHGPTILGR